MTQGPRYSVKFRRRREGKTDYRYRLKLLKSGKVRAVVRKTLTNIYVQFIEYDEKGDRVIATAMGSELKKFGFDGSAKSTPSAYLAGFLAARRALKKNVNEAVLDIGLQSATKGARVFAALKGILDAGIDIPHNEEVLPEESRITGGHLKKGKPIETFSVAKANIESKY